MYSQSFKIDNIEEWKRHGYLSKDSVLIPGRINAYLLELIQKQDEQIQKQEERIRNLELKEKKQMCDHNDVTNLEIKMLQASDGFTRYKCKHCGEIVKKDAGKDVEFNRLYKRYYNLCSAHASACAIDHKTNEFEILTYENNEGKTCCRWCGVEVN